MLYFVIISSSFRKSSLDELKKAARFKIVDEFNNMLIIESKNKNLQNKMSDSIFTSTIFPLFVKKRFQGNKYLATIISAISAIKVKKRTAFKLECIDINSRQGLSAKDIEVKIGMLMEKKGFNINIIDPEILGYVVLLNNTCYAGYADYKKLNLKFVNPYRYYHTTKQISRSEIKLRQAFDAFNVHGNGVAIDLGAAPGGWSGFLAKNGFKIIAIDKGELDYKAFSTMKIKLKKVDAKEKIDAKTILEKYQVIHINNGFDNVVKNLKVKDVSLLADDMNIDCKATSAAVKRYLKFLKNDAELIITIKCINKNVPKYIKQAELLLGNVISIKRMKVLPNNRQEFTLYARYYAK